MRSRSSLHRPRTEERRGQGWAPARGGRPGCGRTGRFRSDRYRETGYSASDPARALGHAECTVLDVDRRDLERRVRRVRHLARRDLWLVVRSGRPHHHPGKPRVLHPYRFHEPAGAARRHDGVHDQPGFVRSDRKPRALAVQLGHPGRLRDRGNRPGRPRGPGAGSQGGGLGKHRAQDRAPDRGGVDPGTVALRRARRDVEGPEVAGFPLRRPLHHHGDHHRGQGQPAHHAARSRLGRTHGRPRPHNVRRRPRLDRERQRLLPLPPANSSKRGIIVAVALGGGIPSILLEVLGAAVATAVPVSSAYSVASVTGLASVFSSWFVIPYLVVAIVQLFAINSVDLYSSGVTLQSLGFHLKRYQCVMIDTVVSGAFASYVIFSQHFSQLLSDFLLFVIVWVAPWCAIYLVDYYLRRGQYDNEALQDEKAGIYYRDGGLNWRALAVLGIGMVAAALWLNVYSPYVSPLSSRLGGSDFSIFMGLFFGGVSYFLLARKSVPTEGRHDVRDRLLSPSVDARRRPAAVRSVYGVARTPATTLSS